MTTLDHRWASNQFRHNRNCALLTLATMQLMSSEEVFKLEGKLVVLKRDGLIFNPEMSDRTESRFEVDLGQMAQEFKDAPDRFRETLFEYWKAARRNLIKECFEVTLTYADANDSFPSLESEPWFQFARIVRNCLSHDFHFRFRKKDFKYLPATWAGKTIDVGMNDTDMPNDFLDPHTTWELYDQMLQFVQSH